MLATIDDAVDAAPIRTATLQGVRGQDLKTALSG